MTRPLRRAGSPWRILVHEYVGKRGKDGPKYGRAYNVTNDPAAPERHAETHRQLYSIRPDVEPPEDATSITVLEGTEFDELVIGEWIHLEQMDTGRWWCNLGGVTINIQVDRDGRPKRVRVSGPGDYAEPEEGCEYTLEWSAGD